MELSLPSIMDPTLYNGVKGSKTANRIAYTVSWNRDQLLGYFSHLDTHLSRGSSPAVIQNAISYANRLGVGQG